MSAPGRRPAADTRRLILEAASRLTARDGVSSLTLEAVAAEAGVSKGGLLYHFASKQQLVRGMVDHLVAEVEQTVTSEVAREQADSPGRATRAYARATFALDRERTETAAGLVAALATDPALLEPLRAQFAALQQVLEADGIDPTVATVVRLATEGLLFADLFGLEPPRGARRAAALAYLQSLTAVDGEDPPSRPIRRDRGAR